MSKLQVKEKYVIVIDDIMYYGNFKDEKPHGDCIKYHYTGDIAYNGQWNYDLKYFQGKQYYENRNLKNEGKWIANENDIIQYEGE